MLHLNYCPKINIVLKYNTDAAAAAPANAVPLKKMKKCAPTEKGKTPITKITKELKSSKKKEEKMKKGVKEVPFFISSTQTRTVKCF